MKIHYQVATPEVTYSEGVTSMQGDIYENIDKLKSYGYDGVELMTRDSNLINRKKIIEYITGKGMNISLICSGEVYGGDGLTLTDPSQTVREKTIKRLEALTDFAHEASANLNIGRVRGFYCSELTKEETDMLAVENIRRVCDYAEKKGVRVLMEPVTRLQTNFINSTQEGIEFCKKVDRENFKLMLDIYHMNIEDECIVKSFREAKGYVEHIHMAENNRRILGSCGMNLDSVIATLREIDYSHALSMEIFQIPNQDEAAKKSIEHLRQIIG